MKDLLKILTCGSVDDGKSTLIGHMLYDAKLIFTDQMKTLELESKAKGKDNKLDYSLLLDGLMAEREQGITIDVAYRFFNTDKRSFIVADSPGHEQYTRNMAVGASFADLAIILVDAKQGILTQTKRHTYICALMGIKDFVLAVNKMDLIKYDKEKFNRIKEEFEEILGEYKYNSLQVIPVSATEGTNITENSKDTPWYKGKPLLPYLEDIDIKGDDMEDNFVMPVQRVSKLGHRLRGFQGQIESGDISVGEKVVIQPSGEEATVKKIYMTNEEVKDAFVGQPVSIVLDRDIDISRGSVLTKGNHIEVGDMFTATILWMDESKLIEGRSYKIKSNTQTFSATVMKIRKKKDIDSSKNGDSKYLFKNEIAVCDVVVSDKLVFEKFEDNEAMGGFILIDILTGMTSGCGVIENPLIRSSNVKWHEMDVNRDIRAQQKVQKPLCLWFTGLSGSGKSTLASKVEKRLTSDGKHTMLLDGDNIRHGLNRDLGFSEGDRVENIRRIAEVVKLMNDAGLIVITSFISPYEQDRENAKEIVGKDNFIEIYVSTPLEVCEKRDVKGLYKRARSGEIKDFTGIDSPYEEPKKPNIEIDTSKMSIEEATEKIMKEIEEYL